MFESIIIQPWLQPWIGKNLRSSSIAKQHQLVGRVCVGQPVFYTRDQQAAVVDLASAPSSGIIIGIIVIQIALSAGETALGMDVTAVTSYLSIIDGIRRGQRSRMLQSIWLRADLQLNLDTSLIGRSWTARRDIAHILFVLA